MLSARTTRIPRPDDSQRAATIPSRDREGAVQVLNKV